MGAHGQTAVNRARGVFEQAGLPGADGRNVVGVFRSFGYWGTFDERQRLVQHRHVIRGAQVVQAGKGQPQQIVRKVRAHARAVRRVPPVLHVALRKLARGRGQDLLAQQVRRAPGQRQCVLQLVTKPGGTTGLIEAGFAPQAASHGLVGKPAVHQGIEQGVGRRDLRRLQQRVPPGLHLALALFDGFGCSRIGQCACLLQVRPETEQEHVVCAGSGLQVD